jgi:hypothetical protein
MTAWLEQVSSQVRNAASRMRAAAGARLHNRDHDRRDA